MKTHCLLLALLLLALPAAADDDGEDASPPLGVGDELPALELEDQFDQGHRIGDDVKLLLFSRDMEGGDAIKEALAEDGAEFLARYDAVYVADVSGMPALVRRLMAKPAMRRRGYPMLLDEDGAATARLPAREGRATLLFLDQRRVARIEYVDSSEALRDSLEPAEPEPAD